MWCLWCFRESLLLGWCLATTQSTTLITLGARYVFGCSKGLNGGWWWSLVFALVLKHVCLESTIQKCWSLVHPALPGKLDSCQSWCTTNARAPWLQAAEGIRLRVVSVVLVKVSLSCHHNACLHMFTPCQTGIDLSDFSGVWMLSRDVLNGFVFVVASGATIVGTTPWLIGWANVVDSWRLGGQSVYYVLICAHFVDFDLCSFREHDSSLGGYLFCCLDQLLRIQAFPHGARPCHVRASRPLCLRLLGRTPDFEILAPQGRGRNACHEIQHATLAIWM